MNLPRSLRPFVLLLAAPLLAQKVPVAPEPSLAIGFAPGLVQFEISGPPAPFVGIVLVSLVPDLQHFLVGLPPLLDQAVVLDWGLATGRRYGTAVSEFVFPPGVMIHVQGVTLSDVVGLQATETGSFVLDATGGGG